MFAIYKRELKAYFHSFIGFLFMAVTLFFVSLYFFVYNLFSGYPYFSYAISGVTIIFLASVPILSMRVLAEERKNKTDQMILTAPVTVGAVVCGKFFALLTIFAIPTAIICTYPFILTFFGTVPIAEAYLAILGFFLYGMACIAVGVFISSLTESQVIAAVITFITLFVGYMMPSLCSLISETGNWITKILSCLDMVTPFTEFLNGALDVKSLVYFLLLTFFMLFLTVQSIQKRRYSVSVKNLSLSAYSTGAIVLVACIIVGIHLVIGELPKSMVNFDVTKNQLYTISDQTKDYLNTIESDITIYVIASKDSRDETLHKTLEKYADFSEHITISYVDPNVNPKFYQNYTDSLSMNSLIVESDKRYKVIDYNDIYETDYDYNYATGSYSGTTTGYDGEGQITSALDFVLSDEMPKIYMTTGHGEYKFSTTFLDAIKKLNAEYEDINLMDVEEIPADAACLVINAPTADINTDDKDKILSFMNQGGDVIYITGYAEEKMPNITALLAERGVSISTGLLVEQDASAYYRNPYILLPKVVNGIYTQNIYGNYYILAPYSRGILTADTENTDIIYGNILSTTNSAFSKVGTPDTNDYSKSPEDVDGPFGVGIYARKAIDDSTDSDLIVYGCAQMFADEANTMVAGANLMLFSNTISHFVSHDMNISIPVKNYDMNYLVISQKKAVWIGITTMLLIPLAMLVSGFVIWFKRRKK